VPSWRHVVSAVSRFEPHSYYHASRILHVVVVVVAAAFPYGPPELLLFSSLRLRACAARRSVSFQRPRFFSLVTLIYILYERPWYSYCSIRRGTSGGHASARRTALGSGRGAVGHLAFTQVLAEATKASAPICATVQSSFLRIFLWKHLSLAERSFCI